MCAETLTHVYCVVSIHSLSAIELLCDRSNRWHYGSCAVRICLSVCPQGPYA